jgi:DNA-binding MarR family transcriptional regulator
LQVYLASLAVIVYADIIMTRKTNDTVVNDNDLTDFGQAIGLLLRRLRAMSNLRDLSWTQASIMARLDKEGPATTAELARAEGVKPQSMGTTIAALEKMGIVKRMPHPTDGRQMNIELTAEGLAVRKSTKEARWTWFAHAVAQLDGQEREALFAAGKIIKRLVEL